jgi:lipopolysaccharide/colanic/teichoic acid biosynthesis glycosyltransferase
LGIAETSGSSENMELIILHENNNGPNTNSGLLSFAAGSETIADVLFKGLHENCCFYSRKSLVIAAPIQWNVKCTSDQKLISYGSSKPICLKGMLTNKNNDWFVVSNGRFATTVDYQWLMETLDSIQGDIIAANISPALMPYRENVRITSENKVVGFRRWYSNAAQPALPQRNWPHHLFIKNPVVHSLLRDDTLTLDFNEFLSRCRENGIRINSIDVAGELTDLETEQGMLRFLAETLNLINTSNGSNANIHDSARLFGRISIGKNVTIGKNAIVAGPAILADNVIVQNRAVVKNAVLGPKITVHKDNVIQNCVLTNNNHKNEQTDECRCSPKPKLLRHKNGFAGQKHNGTGFRIWSSLSYVRFLKRIGDIIIAALILALFLPAFPIIALIIKISSAGPVFYKDKRQGLHGKNFNCLKFRSMVVSADTMQEKLRVVNKVDGPQFKMEHDPRINMVGNFLRNTYIDEIPQFLNVLIGQMSVVGPRPSPEQENSLCPYWRDARLSVRPGITGLWQICRTREESKDFQEWVRYDTEYVRNISLNLDLWICFKTATKLINNFIDQF